MAPPDFTFDADLATASTISSASYREPQWLELESDRVFGRSWQLVGRTTRAEDRPCRRAVRENSARALKEA